MSNRQKLKKPLNKRPQQRYASPRQGWHGRRLEQCQQEHPDDLYRKGHRWHCVLCGELDYETQEER